LLESNRSNKKSQRTNDDQSHDSEDGEKQEDKENPFLKNLQKKNSSTLRSSRYEQLKKSKTSAKPQKENPFSKLTAQLKEDKKKEPCVYVDVNQRNHLAINSTFYRRTRPADFCIKTIKLATILSRYSPTLFCSMFENFISENDSGRKS
jgi:hypothetical protein